MHLLARAAFSRSSASLLLLGLLFAWVAPAAELPLAKVTSSYPQGYQGTLIAQLGEEGQNSPALQGITYTDSRGTRLDFTIEDLRKGAVLIHALGKDLLRLKAPQIDARAGGDVQLIFYRKFFSEDQRTLTFELVDSPTQTFEVRTNDSAGRDSFDRLQIKLENGFIPSGVERIELFQGTTNVRRYDPNQLPKARPRVRASVRRD